MHAYDKAGENQTDLIAVVGTRREWEKVLYRIWFTGSVRMTLAEREQFRDMLKGVGVRY